MSGLASRNRHHRFDWQAGAPYPGELDYLSGRASHLTYSHGQRGPTGTRGCVQAYRKTVNSDTQVRRG